MYIALHHQSVSIVLFSFIRQHIFPRAGATPFPLGLSLLLTCSVDFLVEPSGRERITFVRNGACRSKAWPKAMLWLLTSSISVSGVLWQSSEDNNNIEGVFLNRVCILGFFYPKRRQGFKPSAAYLYPEIDRVPPGKRINKVGIVAKRLAIKTTGLH